MASAKFNIILEEGGSFQKQILWTDASNSPVSLLYWWARLGIVTDYGQGAASQAIFLEADAENQYGSKLTIDETGGTIDVFISTSEIANALSNGFKRGFWDLELIPSDPNSISVYAGSYTNGDFDAFDGSNPNGSFASITADHAAANYDSLYAEDDIVVVRGLTAGTSGACDGIYKVGSGVTDDDLFFKNVGYFSPGGDSATNPDMKIWRLDESKAVRLIGGKVSINESATERMSVVFE